MRLIIQGVDVRYGEREVLRGANATIDTGMCALMGPSGSGKSTLLGVVAGQVTPHAGTVIFEEVGPRVDWIVQSAPVLSRRSALENVMLGPLATGIAYAPAEDEARQALDRLGLTHVADQPAFRLSGGERQRVAVARVLASSPAIILADEPTASLDAASRATVCDALEAVAASGRIVLIATHDPYVRDRCARGFDLVSGLLVAS